MKLNKTGVFVGSKIPAILKESILETVKRGQYISISDFVRDAVKEKLQKEGYSWNSHFGSVR